MRTLKLLFLTILFGCSGIKMIPGGGAGAIYSEQFLSKIKIIKENFAKGDSEKTLAMLLEIQEPTLKPTEIAMKNNLLGVVYFSTQDYEMAVSYFDKAIANSTLDPVLTSQISLNLASSYFKMNYYEKALTTLKTISAADLPKEELEKYYLLIYETANFLDFSDEAMLSLVSYLGKYNSLDEVIKDPFYEKVVKYLKGLESSPRLNFVERISEKSKNLASAQIAYEVSLEEYYQGDKDKAKDLFDFISSTFQDYPEVISKIENFNTRIEKYSQIDTKKIGVILPLSGKYKSYGERAFRGIDFAFRQITQQNEEFKNYKYVIRDSGGSAAAGAYYLTELVEKEKVSIVIGGLLPEEATKEYIEAQKSGVLFISLQQVLINQEKKNHLLVEVPGSLESIGKVLFSKEMIEVFGNRAAIIYPDTQRGRTIVDVFWKEAQRNNVEIKDFASFEKGVSDLRAPVKNVLELSFKRERQEEFQLLSEVHELEKSTSVRRIQTLRPVLDFDWVFVPAYPKDALQIIPSFGYFDAFNLNIIGGPSWRSKSIVRESGRTQQSIFFVGDEIGDGQDAFIKSFYEIHKKRAGIIEIQTYDALWLALQMLHNNQFDSRQNMDFFLKKQTEVKSFWSRWYKDENLWVKDLTTFKMNQGNFVKVID
jgi:outer membrane PBP1 activator LpoA protein